MSEPGTDAPSEEDDRLIGRTIAGKFVIERRLGAGAMGAVYRAHQTALDRPVAIKVLHGRFASDATYAARLHLEAKAVSRLDHPNLIRVHDFGREPDGLLYIAMEYLDCRDLFEIVTEESPLPQGQIVDILSQVLSGLAEAHDAGVLHRDIKPENIMVLPRKGDDGRRVDLVKVCDFGIAKIVEMADGAGPEGPARRKLTSAGLVIGTPEYMPPEQARGEAFDARSDVYAVGVVLYRLLTGRLPFVGGSSVEIVFKAMNEEPEPLDSRGRTAAPPLDSICRKAMSRRPEDRYQSAREMRAALVAVSATGAPERVVESAIAPAGAEASRPHAAPDDSAERAPRPSARGRTFGAFLAVVVGGTAVLLRVCHAPLHTETAAAPTSITTSLTRSTGADSVAQKASAEPGATTVTRLPSESKDPPADPRPRSAAGTTPSRREGRRGADPSLAAASPTDSLSHPSAPPATPPAASLPSEVTDAPVLSPVSPSSDLPHASLPPAPMAVGQRAATEAELPAPDPASARVVVGRIRCNSAAVTSGSVSRAIEPLLERFTHCYRDALASGARAKEGASATLHIETDDGGYVTLARVSGDVPASAARCIEALSKEMHLAVDTGTADVDLGLTFGTHR